MIVKTILDNGIRVLIEDIPTFQSVAIGVWVNCGARVESEASNGISHFLEHMLFKGTTSLSAYDIASQIEATGGSINAFTGKECTSYYLRIPSYHFVTGLKVLADMLKNPAFLQVEIENEKGVVLSEISQLEDTPDEYIHDVFEEGFWKSHPLRLPVLGNREAVQSFSRESLWDFFDSRYRASDIVISIAGGINQREALAVVTELFGDVPRGSSQQTTPLDNAAFVPAPLRVLRTKNTQQVNMVLGVLTFGANDPHRYALSLLNTVLGGAMSSHLFQEVRERRGLAYAIGSFISSYSDTGLLGIYAGTSSEKLQEVVVCCLGECRRISAESFSEKVMTDAKEMLKGGFLLAMEGVEARMTRMAKNELIFGTQIDIEEVLAGIEAVRAEEVLALAQTIFDTNQFSLAVLGDVRKSAFAKMASLLD